MKNRKLLWCSMAVIADRHAIFCGYRKLPGQGAKKARPETNTPQTLPFTQNWSSAALITVDDDWSACRGSSATRAPISLPPSAAIFRPSSRMVRVTAVDVFANHADPDTFISGGVTEFDGIANPVVALQGSATADVPHIVIHLNTTGNTGINFACNLRDIDNSADDSAQQVNIQYRVGGTGDYTNVSGRILPRRLAGPDNDRGNGCKPADPGGS